MTGISIEAPRHFVTARLRLRPMGRGDAAAILSYAGSAAATRFMNFKRTDLAGAQDFADRCDDCWRDGSAFPWAIHESAGDAFVGCIELRLHPPKADFGYVLAEPFWGQGYASEAARVVADWAIAQPGIFRVWASCHPDNYASARVLQKAGLLYEARVENWETAPNLGLAAHPSLIFARLRAAE